MRATPNDDIGLASWSLPKCGWCTGLIIKRAGTSGDAAERATNARISEVVQMFEAWG